jgi:hypothetical protein
MLDIELLDVLICIPKGSRVIDWTETDWGKAFQLDRRYVESRFVWTKTEARDCLGSRFDTWWKNPDRWIEPTLEDAMRFADDVANGRSEQAEKRHEEALLERRIDDLERKNWTLRPRLVAVVGGENAGLFVQEEPQLSTKFLSQQERYQHALAEYVRLSKEVAERPVLPGDHVPTQLVLPIKPHPRPFDPRPHWLKKQLSGTS